MSPPGRSAQMHVDATVTLRARSIGREGDRGSRAPSDEPQR
ncbi:hypothetical protein HMPREF1549_01363 [Actinomyces johnsonii F0510]|uniref:Uncharacterized protein n=1 Tax=Actinomyces johnsonii F0510 TaxID=1227262 RepID=U1RN82_9ACTO|nr:hypothetical protein HMPREF1549_01363 [Actinomyces johnsonii F0510]